MLAQNRRLLRLAHTNLHDGIGLFTIQTRQNHEPIMLLAHDADMPSLALLCAQKTVDHLADELLLYSLQDVTAYMAIANRFEVIPHGTQTLLVQNLQPTANSIDDVAAMTGAVHLDRKWEVTDGLLRERPLPENMQPDDLVQLIKHLGKTR